MFGKVASDLQTGIVVGTDSISGTARLIRSYPGFYDDPTEPVKSYFLALMLDNHEHYDISVSFADSSSIPDPTINTSLLDEYGVIVANFDIGTSNLRIAATSIETGEHLLYSYDLGSLTPPIPPTPTIDSD